MKTFNVGDIVETTVNRIGNTDYFFTEAEIGTRGVIISIDSMSPPIGVKFDKPINHGHTCEGLCTERGCGWYVYRNQIRVVK